MLGYEFDLKRLNKAVKRERYVLPTVEEMAAKLVGSTVFSKLDAARRFWQVSLDENSAELTTFITSTRQYCFQRLQFGIISVPEPFQRKMEEGLSGVTCYMDDIIVYGNTASQHDQRLKLVSDKIKQSGLRLYCAKV